MGDRYDRRRRLVGFGLGTLPEFEPFFAELPLLPQFGIGHNNGPPLDSVSWGTYCWQKANKRAWANPPIEVIRIRMKRAQELGMTYREYTAIIMDRGVYL